MATYNFKIGYPYKGTYVSSTSYSLNASVSNTAGTQLYVSLADNNTAELTDTTKWKEYLKGMPGEFDGVQTVTGTDVTQELQPNILYTFGEVTSLSLTLATPTNTARVNEYMFQFTSGTTATTLTLPSTVKWIGSHGIAASMIYQVSIVNNIAVMGGASNE